MVGIVMVHSLWFVFVHILSLVEFHCQLGLVACIIPGCVVRYLVIRLG